MYLTPMQAPTVDYEFREDLVAEVYIRDLLQPPTARPQVQFREPEELLRPYLMPKLRDELIREDFPELARTKKGHSAAAVR